MSFGTNPHLAKAQSAEQKAEEAEDSHARAMAHREAAHQWDRAAAREKPGKRRAEYEASAERNRALADAADADDGPVGRPADAALRDDAPPAESPTPSRSPGRQLLN